MRDLLDEDSHEDDTAPVHHLPQFIGEAEALVFPTMVPPADSQSPQLLPGEVEVLWTAYENNVAPLVKIFHHPTLKALYDDSIGSHSRSDSRTKAVLSAVQFAAVVSLSPEDCEKELSQPKASLIYRLRCEADRAFTKAGLMNTSSVLVLQAFVLYLTSMRRCDDTWLVLNWIGLAVRIAISLGLHRDGLELGLDSFSTEMRRRLWWHLMLLECDLSEGHGVDSMLSELSCNTRWPMNLDDCDIQPGMVMTPEPRNGFTGMTSSLVRYEMMFSSRQILPRRGEVTLADSKGTKGSLKGKLDAINECKDLLEQRYFRQSSEALPLQWATQQVLQVRCKMLRFSVCHVLGLGQELGSKHEDQAFRDTLFATAVEVIDGFLNLESDPRTHGWHWYYRSDVFWPALVYLLNEVIRRPSSPTVNHAWSVIKGARRCYHAGLLPDPSGTQSIRGMLFRPMMKLTAKAFVVKDAGARQEDVGSRIGTFAQIAQGEIAGNRSDGLQQTNQPFPGDHRASGQVFGDDDFWSSDRLSAFENFWNGPELDTSTTEYVDSPPQSFAAEDMFANFLR